MIEGGVLYVVVPPTKKKCRLLAIWPTSDDSRPVVISATILENS